MRDCNLVLALGQLKVFRAALINVTASKVNMSNQYVRILFSVPYDVEVIDLHSTSESGRRTKLPCYKADTDVSLWNILKKNIGKDLSKVAMPVTLNEPLNALQVCCYRLFLQFTRPI